MHFRAFILAAAVAAPPLLHAQAPVELDPLVVTATRTEVRESGTLASITVITRDDIERAQAADVAELLRFVAGIETARAGGPGQFASAFIRGGNSQHTLVLLDGVRLNPATQGAALQNITPDMVERIEIVRGPRSTLYGSEAMGGVVQVITRRRAAAEASLRARYGSYDTRELSGSASAGTAGYGARLHASQLDSAGFPSHRDSDDDRGHRNTTIDARGDLTLGALALDASAWNAQGRTEYLEDANPFCFPCTYTSFAALDFHNRALAAGAAWSPLEALQSKLTLEQSLDDLTITEGAFAGSETRNERTAGRWQNDLRPDEATRLSLGLEAAHERARASGVDEARDVFTVSLADEYAAGPHRALLAASVLDHDAFGRQMLWNAEYGYEWPSATRLSVGGGTGFRAPNVIERFFPGYGNPDLGPERARSVEAGVRQQLGAHRVELRAFRTEYENLIAFDPSTFLAGNVAHARNQGLELSWRWLVTDATSLRLGGVAQDPRQCEPDCEHGPLLVRRARRTATLQLATRWRGVDYGLDALAAGPRRDFDSGDFSPATLPGYAVVNLSGGGAVYRRWSLHGKIENVLDRDYETVEGYRQPGRSAFLTVSCTLL